MKNLLFITLIFCALKVNAQNYLITFTGTGASTTVNSIKVENLTANTFLILSGSDVLRLTLTTGINSIENKQLPEMNIYPNPSKDNSTVEFISPEAGDAIIAVYDITGKLVTQNQYYLDNDRQIFRLSGLKNGLYFINVRGRTYQFSGKLISSEKSTGTIKIEKVANNIQSFDKKEFNMGSKGIQSTVDMSYSPGERIKFTGISGIYSTVITDIPAGDKTITFNFIACTDGDGINYSVVGIGTQVWMAENLAYIPSVNPSSVGSETIPYYYVCGYQGTNVSEAKATSNYQVYGVLYNWPAAINACPSGWHLPSDAEWKTLEMYLGMSQAQADETGWRGTDQGTQLKSTSGWPYYDICTNTCGFSALPGSFRRSDGSFGYIGYSSDWWSSTEYSEYNTYGVWKRYMYPNYSGVYRLYSGKEGGISVRCLRDY
jgi:uncharacterized protein (TIGR02145 family)